LRKQNAKYYPAFLDLRDQLCVVVGGGNVAERKTLDLLRAGARVKVISPGLTSRLQKEKNQGSITHVNRRFRQQDLKGSFLVIAATDSEEENRKVAGHKGLLLNVVDRPELCTFIVPATLRRGPLQIAVSTSGASPAMARAIRKDMESTYGPQFGKHLNKLKRLREKAVKEIKSSRERERYLKSLASENTVRMLKKSAKKTVAAKD
jgi:precorrin-2 dehydrogenase/sirohydrochlorin ferrochelatase